MSVQQIEHRHGTRLGWAVGLTIVAFLIVGGLGVAVTLSEGLVPYARLINMAGRQRMLSQMLAKDAYLLMGAADGNQQDALRRRLEDTRRHWLRVHRGLSAGDRELKLPGRNSSSAARLLDDAEPLVQGIDQAVQRLMAIDSSANPSAEMKRAVVMDLLSSTETYLSAADRLVAQYELDNQASLWRRQTIIGGVLIIAIALILQAAMIIRRLMSEVRHRNSQLLQSNSALRREVELHGNAEDALRTLYVEVEQADEGIIVTDTNGKILYVNPAIAKISGYPRESILGQRPSMLKSGKQDGRFYQDMWATLTAGNVWRGRIVNRRNNGSLFTTEQVLSPVIEVGGKITNFIGIMLDITARIMLEERSSGGKKWKSSGRWRAASHTISTIC